MKAIITALAISLLLGPSAYASMSDANDIHQLVAKCAPGINADSKVAVGIVKTESAGNPFSIGINTKGIRLKRQPETLLEAIEVATWLAKNRYNFDAGLAQINSVNINKLLDGDLDFRMRKVFDPCSNLQLAQTIFNSCYDMTGSTAGALSCYNTGDGKKGIRNGYVARVLANIPALVDVDDSSKVPTLLVVSKEKKTTDASGDKISENSKAENEGDSTQKKNKKDDSGHGDVFATNGNDDVFDK
ncbi:lytic transglycosylase domain-containing protein [Cronobacter sakazakii]|nr:lytic transglycosylase domain-containing protein [Cronobacter sakazakii]